MAFPVIITLLVGYLLGNLNGAVSMSILLNDDVRSHGSGNAGLTNFVRNFGFGKGIAVMLIDISKAVLACLVGRLLLTPYDLVYEGMMLGALGVSLGHDFPALLGFRGGKGVLSGLAIAATVDWRCAVLILTVFLICLLITKYVSLSSILGSLSFSAFFGFVYYEKPLVMAVGIFLGLMVVFMHRSNIVRLVNGTERKVGKKKKENQ